MKTKGMTFILLLALVMLTACGKKNESGKSQNQWGFNPYTGLSGTNPNSPYSYGGQTLNQVLQANPCISGFGGYNGYNNNQYQNQRLPIQVPLVNFPGVISPGDVYVGVTSYGDVAVVTGGAPGSPPMFIGYMCPRSFAQGGQGQLMDVKIGAYTQCIFKPITAAIVAFPGGASANFRMLDGGTSFGFSRNMFQPFPFCRQ